MKKITVFMMVVLFAAGSLKAVIQPEKNEFLGEWKFESTYAPEGYQKGLFSIAEKEGQLTGEIRFADGYKVEMKDMLIAGGVLKFGINVDYNYVNIKATIEGKKLKGSAATPEGDLPFEAEKIKK
jgi:hypothetical protein